MQIDRRCTCGSEVIDVSSLNNYSYLKNRVFNFSSTKRKLKTIQNLTLYVFWFFTGTLTLLLPVQRWVCDNTNLLSDGNFSKTIRVNITCTEIFLRMFNKLSNGMQGDRLPTCGSQVIDV